jgi:DNA-binding CsgD family transcriptional regulator
VYTFIFFNVQFMQVPPEVISLFSGVIHFLISLVILLTYPPFIFRVIGSDDQKWPRVLSFVSSALLFLFLFLAYLFRLPAISIALNVLFNLYLFCLSLFGFRRLKSQKIHGLRKTMMRFLGIAARLYALLIISTSLILFIPPSWFPVIGLLFTALFSIIWSVLMIRELVTHKDSSFRKVAVSDSFLSDYGISGREKEVLEKLIQGKSNKMIADELFISTRTVETHVYKIYRKCEVSNKVELIRILENT